MGRKSVHRARKEKTKAVEKWTQALLSKLKDKPLKNLTINDLALLIGKSKSTIYEYFNTKEEIFEYITTTRIEELKSYKHQLTLHSFSTSFSHDVFVSILSKGVRDISSFYLSELKTHYPTAWAMVMSFLNELLSDLKEIYTLGITLNIFKNISPDLLIKLDEYFIVQLLTDYQFLEHTGLSLEMVIKDYLTLRFEGLQQ